MRCGGAGGQLLYVGVYLRVGQLVDVGITAPCIAGYLQVAQPSRLLIGNDAFGPVGKITHRGGPLVFGCLSLGGTELHHY